MQRLRVLWLAILMTLCLVPAAVMAQEGESAADSELMAEVIVADDAVSAESNAPVAQENSAVGAWVVIALLALVLVLVGVVAVIGAVGLGVIGIGYWQSSPGDE